MAGPILSSAHTKPKDSAWTLAGPIAASILLLAVNLLIGPKLFTVEYSAYLESNEGSFIAIARQIALHPGHLSWWPFWDCGLPFKNAYLPLVPMMAGWASRLSGHSPALAYHQVCAFFYCVGPVFVFLMAWTMTRESGPSLFAALGYSLVSPVAWLVPAIQNDIRLWSLRRLEILGYYGEGPHTVALAFLPLAILFLFLATRKDGIGLKILAGIFIAATVLSNAFGATILVLTGLALLAVAERGRFLKTLGNLAAIGILSYLWISPLVPPSVLAAIRTNSPTVDGDYRFTLRSLAGVAIMAAGFLVLAWITRGIPSAALRFFLLYTLLTSSVVLLGTLGKVYIFPQPHRYQIAADLGFCLSMALGAHALLRRWQPKWIWPAAGLVLIALAFQCEHDVRAAHRNIRRIDITATSSYRFARWMDEHMGQQRVLVPGSYSFQFNDFTDTPQFLGGHDPMLTNIVMRVAGFVVNTGADAGAQEGEIRVLWLKALGVHAIGIPGPHSEEKNRPFLRADEFEKLLPVLWRENDDTIYGVPALSGSLAHVIPAAAAMRHTPVNVLDVADLQAFVQALEDPALPHADFAWTDDRTASIRASVQLGQAVSVQETYDPGWRARANGAAVAITKDGLGLMVLEPACNGPCDITLTYDDGTEGRFTMLASLIVMAGCLVGLGRASWTRRTISRRRAML